MTRLYERAMEAALLLTALLSGGILFHDVARVQGEPVGCANNTCKDIDYYFTCSNGVGANGVSLQVSDCLMCAGGRCNKGGVLNICQNPNNNPQGLASTPVTQVCDCKNAPNQNASVEANGSYTGPWNKSQVNQRLCSIIIASSGINPPD